MLRHNDTTFFCENSIYFCNNLGIYFEKFFEKNISLQYQFNLRK